MPNNQFLDSKEVADMLGITTAALRVKRTRTRKRIQDEVNAGLPGQRQNSDVPEPDIDKGRSPLWERSTIERWLATRPDPGRRNRNNL